ADTSLVSVVFNRETLTLSRQRLSSSNYVPIFSVRSTCEKSSSACSNTLCLLPTKHGGSSLSVPNKALHTLADTAREGADMMCMPGSLTRRCCGRAASVRSLFIAVGRPQSTTLSRQLL